MKEYVDKPFPWVSKSKIGSLDYCRYSFWLERIKNKKDRPRESAIEGTNMHMVVAAFFKYLKPEHVFKDKFTDARTKLEIHPFRKFIYEGCMRFVKPEQRGWGKYKNVLNNFATVECKRWLYLNTILHDKDKIFKYFKPLFIEKRLEHEGTYQFGTIDRINYAVMPDESVKIEIIDYKTGSTPKAVMNYKDNTGKMFDCKLPSRFMKEIHFYGLLYLLMTGWQLHDKVIEFLNDKEMWYVKKDDMSYKETKKAKSKYLTELKKNFKSTKQDYKLFKEGRELKKGDILVGYYFLGGDKGYHVTKEYGYPSHKSAILAINDYRTVIHNKFFVTNPEIVYSPDGCMYKNCHRITKCEEEIRMNRIVKLKERIE